MNEAKALMALSNVKILPIDSMDEAATMVMSSYFIKLGIVKTGKFTRALALK